MSYWRIHIRAAATESLHHSIVAPIFIDLEYQPSTLVASPRCCAVKDAITAFRNGSSRMLAISISTNETVQDRKAATVLLQFKYRPHIIAAAKSRHSVKSAVASLDDRRRQIAHIVMVVAEPMD